MKQVVVIHGGDSFPTYDAYFSHLKNLTVPSIDWFKSGTSWKAGLQEALGTEYEVLAPKMPNKENARYAEWKLWFEKLIPFLSDGIVLVGHSLGGVFLARYLAEERFPHRISGTILISALYDLEPGEFSAPTSLALFAEQGGKILLYHSKDDMVVPFVELEKYQRALPTAEARIFDDRKHFNQETFPELIADIQTL